MVEVLREHPEVFGAGIHSWSLADELLAFFDELNLSTFDTHNFLEQFQQGNNLLSNFSADAQKIQILWQARDQHLQQEGVTDRNTLYRNALQNMLEQEQKHTHIYLVGMDSLTTLELQTLNDCSWLHATQFMSSVTTKENTNSEYPVLTNFLDAAFQYEESSLLERASQFRAKHQHSPCADIAMVATGNREEEAAVIDLQIRQWLIEGKQRISVVTEDRLLARRVSALLDRAALEIHDSAGWPLSTTRSAGTVEHWLLSIENDFHSLHLLDLLKSGFLQLTDSQLKSLLVFEKHIIAQEKIYFSIPDYLESIEQYRCSQNEREHLTEISAVLKRLDKAADPLLILCDGRQHDAKEFIQATRASFEILGLDRVLDDDPAGRRILQELEDMRQGLAQRDLKISWTDFRGWFGRAMETHNFRPDLNAGGVTISNYQQSILGNFDAVIIAGCDQNALPKKPARQGIFNNDVRYELGLRNWSKNRDIIQTRFRRLLQAAPKVLLTYTSETARGPQLPSPWITVLESFHKTVWNESLYQTWQLQTVRKKIAEPAIDDDFPLPQRKPQTRANMAESDLPKKMSASKHQTLIDCPYKFFSTSVLGISAWETVNAEFRKVDFGKLVHRCLQEFHSRVPIIKNQNSAIANLSSISKEVFEPILEQQIMNHGWWHTWNSIIPEYINWQLNWQEKNWAINALEQSHEENATGMTKITGILDRIDVQQDQSAVIDYKTGQKSSKAKIMAGEDVQLLTYGMLVDGITDLLYLYVGNKKTFGEIRIAPDDLIERAQTRLADVLKLMKKGADLPAWGHEDICKHCDFIGLCRKGSWNDDETLADTAQQ